MLAPHCPCELRVAGRAPTADTPHTTHHLQHTPHNTTHLMPSGYFVGTKRKCWWPSNQLISSGSFLEWPRAASREHMRGVPMDQLKEACDCAGAAGRVRRSGRAPESRAGARARTHARRAPQAHRQAWSRKRTYQLRPREVVLNPPKKWPTGCEAADWAKQAPSTCIAMTIATIDVDSDKLLEGCFENIEQPVTLATHVRNNNLPIGNFMHFNFEMQLIPRVRKESAWRPPAESRQHTKDVGDVRHLPQVQGQGRRRGEERRGGCGGADTCPESAGTQPEAEVPGEASLSRNGCYEPSHTWRTAKEHSVHR